MRGAHGAGDMMAHLLILFEVPALGLQLFIDGILIGFFWLGWRGEDQADLVFRVNDGVRARAGEQGP